MRQPRSGRNSHVGNYDVHVVFTVPEPLARLALANQGVVYDLLFQATAATLLQVAANSHAWVRRLVD